MDFKDAFNILIDNEGKLSLDKNDRGNWTSGAVGHGELKGSKYGISAMSYPTLDIAKLTLEDAAIIYKRDFWDVMDLDDLSLISFDMFDTAVNSGISKAIKLLQQTVGTKADGLLGHETIQAASSFNPTLLKKNYNANRLLFMTSLSSWDHNSEGWAKRIAHNLLLEY